MAAPFDLDDLTITGPSGPVLDGVFVRTPGPGASFALSQSGTLVYRTLGGLRAGDRYRLVRVDLEGNVEPLALAPRDYQSVSWGPSGRLVAYSSAQQAFIHDLAVGSTPRRVTIGGSQTSPVISRYGRRIVTATLLADMRDRDLVVRTLDQPGAPLYLPSLEGDEYPVQWPLDTLIVFERVRGGSADLWTFNLADPDAATAFH